MQQDKLNKFGIVIFQVAIAIAAGAFSIWVVSLFAPKQSPATNTPPVPVVVSDYETKDKMQSLILISSDKPFANSVIKNADGRNTPNIIFEKNLIVKGTIVGGYLYIDGNVEGKSFDTSDLSNFDDVYINLIQLAPNTSDSKNYAGHLVESRSLKTPVSDTHTELLFPLANISVIADYLNQNNTVTSLNWLPILTQTNRLKIEAFVSIYKKQGSIEKLVIYYSCLENTTCSIETE